MDEVCCEMMRAQLAWSCPDHGDPFDCPDALVVRTDGVWALPIHDGGGSSIRIVYCPWCGARLE